MNTKIDLTHSKFIEIPLFSEDEAKTLSQMNKGWSYSYVYSFVEIRDVFVALKRFNKTAFELSEFFSYCQGINLPFAKTKWNKRRLLEHLNALKNFGLIDPNCKIVKDEFITEIGASLAEQDKVLFRKIYFSYFRFKERISWFINPVPENKIDFVESMTEAGFVKKSLPLFVFSNKSRFTDSYIYNLDDNTTVYYIDSDKKNEDLMRFWDVFVKWGLELGILKKSL